MFLKTTGLVLPLLGITTLIGCSQYAGGVNIWTAIHDEDLDAIERFSSAGGDLNVVSRTGTTPLIYCIDNNKRKSYQRLLELGVDPNFKSDANARVALSTAAAHEESWWLELALKHGGDPNLRVKLQTDIGEAPVLNFAASEGAFENVKLLLQAGADINGVDYKGCSALYEAGASKRLELVFYLLGSGADYTLPGGPKGFSFLAHFRTRNPDSPANTPEERAQILKIRAWLEERGVKFDD